MFGLVVVAWRWMVPRGLWEIAETLIPPSKVRPQDVGTPDRRCSPPPGVRAVLDAGKG